MQSCSAFFSLRTKERERERESPFALMSISPTTIIASALRRRCFVGQVQIAMRVRRTPPTAVRSRVEPNGHRRTCREVTGATSISYPIQLEGSVRWSWLGALDPMGGTSHFNQCRMWLGAHWIARTRCSLAANCKLDHTCMWPLDALVKTMQQQCCVWLPPKQA
jgi:hypothetical protein